MTEDFANYPKTVGEHRSDLSGDASDWAPRDVLIEVLRAIDDGHIAPDSMLVCWYDSKSSASDFRASAPNVMTALGLLARTTFLLSE